MKILADKYLYKLDTLLPENCACTLYDPDQGFPNDAVNYDALLIRTVTKINEQTLPRAGSLKFIGSATAGFDHVDTGHLDNLGIAFSSSEGCNANAVAEYVLTVLYHWAELRNKDSMRQRIGIVGCGNTGGAVKKILTKLGVDTVVYDPPKTIREPEFKSDSLQSLLECDVLTFHTPLTFTGEHATFHLCSSDWLKNDFGLIVNAARGGVVDETALLKALRKARVGDIVLDVWENEPLFSDESMRQSLIATPHIAGYSKQAKFRASEMIVNALCETFGLEKRIITSETSSLSDDKTISIPDDMTFHDFLWKFSNIRFYDESLRKLCGLPDEMKALKFAKLRSETETRDEFVEVVRGLRVVPENLSELSVFR